jgi:hypothetical protein
MAINDIRNPVARKLLVIVATPIVYLVTIPFALVEVLGHGFFAGAIASLEHLEGVLYFLTAGLPKVVVRAWRGK